MSRKRWLSGIASVAVLALLAAACSSNNTTSGGSASGEPTAGGTYRTATQTLSNTSNFDPTGEYYGYAWAMFQNLLIRGLYNYNHIPGEAGNVPQPDLVTDADISSDGLTYAFTIRDNVMWDAPVRPRCHGAGHRVRLRADQRLEPCGVLRQLLLRRDQGHDVRSDDHQAGLRDRRGGRHAHHVPPRGPDRRLPVPPRHAGRLPAAQGSGGLLRPRRRVRQLPGVERRVPVLRRRQARPVGRVQVPEEDRRLQPGQGHHDRQAVRLRHVDL